MKLKILEKNNYIRQGKDVKIQYLKREVKAIEKPKKSVTKKKSSKKEEEIVFRDMTNTKDVLYNIVQSMYDKSQKEVLSIVHYGNDTQIIELLGKFNGEHINSENIESYSSEFLVGSWRQKLSYNHVMGKGGYYPITIARSVDKYKSLFVL